MRRAFVMIGALALVLSACGVTTEDRPVEVDREAVPFGLLEPTTTTTPVRPGPEVAVYFVAADGLVAVPRSPGGAPTPMAAFDELLAGPTSAESRAGLVSEVPAEGLRLVGIRNGLATVRFASDLDTRPGGSVQPVAQIVLTLTEFTTVDRVAFTVGADRVDVPRGDGSVSREPVQRSDYTSMLVGR